MRRPWLVTVLLALAAPAFAHAAFADPVAIRAAMHDGFARIAFDWPAPVEFQAHIADATLTVDFARPLQAKPDIVASALAEYVGSVALEAEGKTLVAHLKRPMTMKSFLVKGTTVVVDLTPGAAPEAAPAKTPAKAPEKTPPAPRVTATSASMAKPIEVRLDAAEKNGITRVTFAWPKRVEYGVSEQAGTTKLTFRAVGDIDAAALARMLPALAPTVAAADGATVIAMNVPPGVHLAYSHHGNAVTLSASGKPALPPAPKPNDVTPPQAALAADAPTAAPAAAQAAADAAAAPDPAPPPAVPPPASLAVHFAADETGPSLRFDWPMPTGAAVFRRGAAVWIVFAAPTRLDLAEPLAQGQSVLDAVTQLPQADATVLRLVPHAGLEPSLRRSGTAWIVSFLPQATPPDAPISAEAHSSASPAMMSFAVHQASAAVRVVDPESGDALLVVPVGELGRGIDVPPVTTDFRALPSVQGIVIRPEADDLAIHIADDAVEVTKPGGLVLSDASDRLLGHVPERAHALFDFDGWLGPPDADYSERRSALEQAIASVAPSVRAKPRLDLAHFYFAHLFGAETLAVLEAIGRDDPALLGDPPVHALKGAACLLADELKCAAEELGQNSLDNEPEAVLWRASLASASGNVEAAAKGFLASASLLPSYPKELRDRFALEGAAALLETDRVPLGGALVDLVLKDHPEPANEAMALYLDGRRAQLQGRLDAALARWDQVAAMDDRNARVRALYSKAVALLDSGRANRAETIKTLDALRFAWRGDKFEFTLLRKLGELELAEGDQDGSLEALHEAAVYFPDIPAAKDVAKEASDAFADLFLGAHGEDLPPVKSLALYDEFHDLEPVGERRDQIVRKLIDRLVAVDLLDRAAGLLEEQVTKRLAGLEKARAATQLALLRLMDHKPADALHALDIDVGRDLPADLVRQRAQLRARVMMETGRPADALSLLSGDQSRDADRLRADIYWRGQDWKNAAATLARLAGPAPAEGKIAPETGRVIVSLAAALTLDNDRAGLAQLRAGFGKAMAASSFADAFGVLAGDGASDAVGDPNTLAMRVAQVGELQNFMAAFKQKLAGTKLSTIN